MSKAKEIEDIQYLLSSENDAGFRTFHALSRDHCCDAMRVVFCDAVHARPRQRASSLSLFSHAQQDAEEVHQRPQSVGRDAQGQAIIDHDFTGPQRAWNRSDVEG